jgi:hypothetical protein
VVSQTLGTEADNKDLASRVNALMLAGQKDPAQVSAAAGRLLEWINQRKGWATRGYANADAAKLRAALLRLAASDGASDYTIAEQVVMGTDSLSYTIGDQGKVGKALTGLYDALADEGSFNASKFTERARAAQAAIK